MTLFVAIDLPPDVRHALAALQGGLRPHCPGWRFVPPGGIHLTLRFLGEVAEERDRPSRSAWRSAAARSRPFDFRIGGLGAFPSGSRPRVLWVGVSEPNGDLESLARGMEEAARGLGFAPEPRSFRPHLTLARAGSDARPGIPIPSPAFEGIEVHAAEAVLFRSELHPAGARYTPIEEFPLGGAA